MELIKNELEFYSKFARPLIFALPDATGILQTQIEYWRQHGSKKSEKRQRDLKKYGQII